jgi:molybdate transport system ATP-binding protein
MAGTLTIGCENLKVTAKRPECQVKERISWGIRPENLRILPETDEAISNENTFHACVKSMVNKGSTKTLALEIKEHNNLMIAEISDQFFESLNLKENDRCLVRIERDRIVLF